MRRTNPHYLLALGLAVASTLFLVLAVGALGIVGDGGSADRMYALVLVVGVVGAVAARLRPAGMTRTMLAMAATQAVLAVVALVAVAAGVDDFEGASVVDVVVINAMYVVLFAASAWLFHRAATVDVPAPRPQQA